MKELIKRFWAKTPVFFKTVQKVCIAFGVLGSTLGAYGDVMGFLPFWVIPFCLGLGALGAFISQLTVEDKNDLK
jgi:hypothetical protein